MTSLRKKLLVGVLGVTAATLACVQARAQSCTPNGNYVFINPSGSIYDISNNPYGDEGSSTEGACVSVTSSSGANDVAWYAQWTQTTGESYDVYAYPDIEFPGGAVSSGLPVQLSSISSIPSVWKYTLSASSSGGYDVAYDIFINPDSNNSGTPIEIMVWTNATFGQDGTDVGTYSTGGLTFTLYQTLPADYAWTTHPVYSFCGPQVSSVNLNLNNFLSYLVSQGYFSSSYYLISVAAGVETRAGTGSLNTSEYDTYVVTGSGCAPTAITPYIQVNSGAWAEESSVTVASGSTVNLGPQPTTGGSWSWTGPNGYTSTSRQISVTPTSTSTYTATYTNSCGATSTQAFTITVTGGSNLIANGTYIITAVNSGLALDDPDSSTTDGEDMDMWTVNDGTNQQWRVTNLGNNVITLTNGASGQLLDVAGASKSNSALVDQWPANGQTNQEWNVISVGSGIYELTSVNSGLALDVVGGGTTNGTGVDQYTYNGNTWQQWKFTSY